MILIIREILEENNNASGEESYSESQESLFEGPKELHSDQELAGVKFYYMKSR